MKALLNALNPPVTHNARYQITFVFSLWCLLISDSHMPMTMGTPYLFAFLIVLRVFPHKNPFRKIVFNFRISVGVSFHWIFICFFNFFHSISSRNGFWTSKYARSKPGESVNYVRFYLTFRIKLFLEKTIWMSALVIWNLKQRFLFSGATFEACTLMCNVWKCIHWQLAYVRHTYTLSRHLSFQTFKC